MFHRAGIILIENGSLAVIKRIRNGCVYYVIPGGGMEGGGTGIETAIREAKEDFKSTFRN
ncbi:NUDIX domain-containing protein [Rossellomorea sp. LjRoot5]|uniref:NUDIX domain-containing protein n=1 Tax=Rossellomorea sp. LjRoot5 TaxID=3342331 RepID=UPI003ED03798